ncbi:MAG: GGDEF domain-containing protein [Ilumatobacteraceae bacterium]
MRFIRVGALVGSVVLLVATSVSMVNERSELRQEQDARVTAAAQLADQSVLATVRRAMALVEVGTADTDPTTLTRSFGAGASACVATTETERCTDVDLLALEIFGTAASASVELGGAALVVDESTGSLLAVSHTAVTTAIRLPISTLIGAPALEVLNEYGASVDLTLSSARGTGVERSGPDTANGTVTVVDTVGLPGDGGTVRVTASIPDEVGFVGDRLALYVTLLALGTVLMALAGWTFLLDRRSLERRATTDELTGLGNRREFERQTEEALLTAERFNTGVCVMLIDLNGFKQINDTLGHQFGDLVLRAAAERLKGAVRETDMVARWGGDEFVILLPGIEDGTGVRASAERIGRSLGDTPIVEDVSVTAAIGAALFPRHGTTLDELVRAADLAMYSAKTTGVNHRLADVLEGDAVSTLDTPSGYRGPDRRRPSVDDDAAGHAAGHDGGDVGPNEA